MDIKFRAWSKDLEEYREFDGNSDDQSLGMGLEAEHGIGSNTISIYHSIGDTIEQFTGLKDIDDDEIYVGDIVFVDPDNPTFTVYFGEGAYQVAGGGIAYNLNEINMDCEIIGNVHERPELLEGE